jgi:2'-5' RNA ligase
MRLFVALDISEELKKELALLEESLSGCHSLRFVKPENIHLTLKFLGEVRDEKLGKVKEVLSGVRFGGVKLSTTRIGTFPGVLWLGVKLGSDLAQLQQKVQRGVLQFAMRDPRPYKPHLTVARFQSLSPQERESVDSAVRERRIEVSWKADSFTLYRSKLTPQGPVYEELAVFGARQQLS